VYYCLFCKKNVVTFDCFTLAITIADFTSSIGFDIIGDHAESLMEIKSIELWESSPERQQIFLSSLRYKNVRIKLKTERKEGSKKEAHSVWYVDSFNIINSLKEINKKLEERSGQAG
jgi:hypothetical protein